MSDAIDAGEADRALKAKHRAIWALGNYPAVASEVIADLGTILVDACRVRSGDRVLDVAAGSGNAAIRAALLGASVVASDLTPESSSMPAGSLRRSAARSSSGGRPMPRASPSRRASSTPCSRAWVCCSPLTTSRRRTRWLGCAGRVEPSGC